MKQPIIINVDGGSRGNPGPSALGVVMNLGEGAIKVFSETLGTITNNEAEYSALIFALKKAKSLLGKEKVKNICVEIRSDSELMVKQLNGLYKVQEPRIQQLFLEAWNLRIDFPCIKLVLVKREENKQADAAVNEALDQASASKTLF